MKKSLLGFLFAIASLVNSGAQLAITEAMSSAANKFGTNSVTQNSDYWELSNFSSRDINLQGYKMADDGADFDGASATPFEGLTIHAHESIVFVQDNVNTNAVSFKAWWGTSLNPAVRIILYHNYGLSASGDGMSLWDAKGVLVDHAHVPAAVPGHSFAYNPTNGVFGVLSSNGLNGAFKAETTDDEGSPGVTTGPVPLFIAQQPTNITVTSGSAVTFKVKAQGLPHPKYQWYFSNSFGFGPLSGQTNSTLSMPGVSTNNAGLYRVAITNGIESIVSSNASLTVTPAPTLVLVPNDLVAYVGQSVSFSVQALGSPVLTFHWQHDGSDLSGQTTTQLNLVNVQTNDSGSYTAAVTNAAGYTNYSFHFLVTPRPNLVITEVMSSEISGSTNVADWWELSNFGDFGVDLYGYRWDDNSADLGEAYTVTNHVIIHPGESVIFVEDLPADGFKNWWGVPHLPPHLQIITYGANGAGLSSSSDQVNLWNQAATANNDPIGKVAVVPLSAATTGTSFVWNPDTAIFTGNNTTGLSTNGLNGAFTAATYGDIGSPGWVVDPLILHINQSAVGADLSWSSTAGRSYTVTYKNQVTDSTWLTLTNIVADSSLTAVTDPVGSTNRLYQLKLALP